MTADGIEPTAELTELDLRLYGRAGLDRAAALRWKAADIGGYEAEAWRRVGVELDEVRAWRARDPKVMGGRYAQWVREGRDLEEAYTEWSAALSAAPEAPVVPASAEDLAGLLSRATLTAGDIADLARVEPSVVTYWRSGRSGWTRGTKPDEPDEAEDRAFPEPLTPGRSPAFKAGEVVDWLRHHDRLSVDPPDPGWYWDLAVKALPGAMPGEKRGRARALVAAEVARAAEVGSCRPQGGPSVDEILKDVSVQKLARQDLRWALAFALASADPELRLVPLLDRALKVLDRLTPTNTSTQDLLAELMAAVMPIQPNTLVLDPACGEGDLLIHLMRGNSQDPIGEGIESDPDGAFVASVRLALRHINASIRVANSLAPAAFPGDRTHSTYRSIVIDPPAGKHRSGHRDWIRLAVTHLSATGTAAIIVPETSLGAVVDTAADAGASVETVVLVPSKLRAGARGAQAVCVLRHAPSQATLRIDVTDTFTRTTGAGSDLIHELSGFVNDWRRLKDQRQLPPDTPRGITASTDPPDELTTEPLPNRAPHAKKATPLAAKLHDLLSDTTDPHGAELQQALQRFLDAQDQGGNA